MDYVSPAGPVYQAGTLSGNPLAMAAGVATLQKIADDPQGVYDALEAYGRALEDGTRGVLREMGAEDRVYLTRAGSMNGLFFSGAPVTDYATAKESDTAAYARYFHAMLDGGVYLAPSAFEASFFSTKHGDEELKATLGAMRRAFQKAFAN
jgi:glutamate-1-semialdehyde 2,1-aminomutase